MCLFFIYRASLLASGKSKFIGILQTQLPLDNAPVTSMQLRVIDDHMTAADFPTTHIYVLNSIGAYFDLELL